MLSDSDEELEAAFRSIQKKDDYRRYKTPAKKVARPPRSVNENWKVKNIPQFQTQRRMFDSDSEAEEINPNSLRTTSIMKDTVSGFSMMKNTNQRILSKLKRVQRTINNTTFDVARSKESPQKTSQRKVPKKQERTTEKDLSHGSTIKKTKKILVNKNDEEKRQRTKSKEKKKRQKKIIEISSDEAIAEEQAANYDAEKCKKITKKRKVRIPDNKVPIAINSSTDDENEGESFRKRIMRRRKYQIHA